MQSAPARPGRVDARQSLTICRKILQFHVPGARFRVRVQGSILVHVRCWTPARFELERRTEREHEPGRENMEAGTAAAADRQAVERRPAAYVCMRPRRRQDAMLAAPRKLAIAAIRYSAYRRCISCG